MRRKKLKKGARRRWSYTCRRERRSRKEQWDWVLDWKPEDRRGFANRLVLRSKA